MKKIKITRICLILIIGCIFSPINKSVYPASNQNSVSLNFISEKWKTVGRGFVEFKNESVIIKDCFIYLKERTWKNHEIQFKARALDNSEQVQIWAGFHFQDRDTRYAVGLRGGNCDDLYLCRYSPNGRNKMLALESLDFHPEPGEWYSVRIIVWDGNIQIYLNNDSEPRIVVADENPLGSGEIVLGGGWIETEFQELTIKDLHEQEINTYKNLLKKDSEKFNSEKKEKIRFAQRGMYQPQKIRFSDNPRSEIALTGSWLFKPDYELHPSINRYSVTTSDQDWHVLDVPNFWNPVRNWLHLQDSNFPHRGSGVSDNYREKEYRRCEIYTFDFKKTTSGWYRHWIQMPSDLQKKKYKLHFDAVSKIADVWINGTFVGSHIGMFGDFEFDITDLLTPGENLIAVHVQVRKDEKTQNADEIVGRAVSVDITNDMLNSLPHGMFQGTEGGFWQPVKLIITNPVFIEDVYAKTKTDGGDFEIVVNNESKYAKQFELQIEIRSYKKNKLIFVSGKKKILCKPEQRLKDIFQINSISPNLWTPENPNLYVLRTNLYQKNDLIDEVKTTIGFRTFQAVGNRFFLNGKPYWLRGANHPPAGIAPNDSMLANRFLQLMHDNNQMITRTHGSPFTKTWLDAADQHGVGVSFEGTWPWLMIDDIPSQELLDIWIDEMLALVKKFRNHPSILIWTINNEMYFTMFNHNKPHEMRLKKWQILSDLIKRIRELDPTRPISCDSGYSRVLEDYEQNLAIYDIDDGDIDDRHIYPGWYNRDFFQFINGEWADRIYWSPGANKDRPFFSQETSTGYPNNDTGHPTRKYLFGHYVPQALVGDWAYEDKNPNYFLQRHAFLTKELAEVIRRTSPESAGLLLFANLCWFRNVFDADRIEPYPVVKNMKNAFQPVLISAELFGRNFYAGDSINPRIYVVNDNVEAKELTNIQLVCKISHDQTILQTEFFQFETIPNHDRVWKNIPFKLPSQLPAEKSYCTFQLKLYQNDKRISMNEYNLILANPSWITIHKDISLKKIAVFDLSGVTLPVLQKIGITPIELKDLTAIRLVDFDLLIVANPDNNPEVPYNWEDIKNIAINGSSILLIHPGKHLQWLLPETVESIYERTGRMVNMHIPENYAFNEIEPLELSWWQSEGRNIPTACRRSFRFKHQNGIEELCTYMRPHVYLSNPTEQLKEMSGSPLAMIELGKGKIIACEMEINSGKKDPIAAKLLANVIQYLVKN